MFTDVSLKIKGCAIILLIAGITGSIIGGYWLFSGYEEVAGIGVIIGGIIVSYITSMFLYGFGELIEKASEISRNTKNKGLSADNKTNTVMSETAADEYNKKLEKLEKLRASGLIAEEEYVEAIEKLNH